MNKLLAIVYLLAVTGCATRDPTLVPGVDREGPDIYSASEMGFNNPTRLAVQQCQLDGNKRLTILTSTTERGMVSGKNYAMLIFRCD